MSINTGDNFRYQGKKYLDDRQSFKTLSELMTYTNVPPGFIAYCEENGERYEYVNDTWILYKVSTDTGDLDLSDYALKTDVPTKTSELENDSGFVTQEHNHNANDIEGLDSAINEALNGASGGTSHVHSNLTTLERISDEDINNWNNKSDFSGSYNELTNKPVIPTVPKHVSAFINDAGYISELPDMNNYATKDELHNHDNKATLDKLTEEKMTSWDNKSDFSGNYNDLSNKPITPTKTSQLINDSGFVTSDNIQNIDLDNYATKAELPTKLSQLENDSGYLKDGDIHTHENKAVLDTIDATKVNKWDNPDYNDLANKPTIPDKVSQLTNDLEFVTREYMQNYIPDLSGIDLSALVGTKFDDAVINEEETTENQTAVDFYANGVIVKTLYLPADGGGGSSDINIDDVIYYGTDEPTNDNVIWFYPNNNDYQGINIDNAIITELMSIIQNMQSQITQLQADVEYLKTHGGSGGGTTPDTPSTTYSYLVLEDGSKLLLEDGGGILLEQQDIIKNSSYLLLEDGFKLLLEDGYGLLLEA